MQSLIKHLHGFVRDVAPTQAEWATGIEWLIQTGQNVLDHSAINHSCYLSQPNLNVASLD
jgi:Catechol dioxygenase N terminus